MKRTVSELEARRTLEEILDAVSTGIDEVSIERDGEPAAVLVSAERYSRLLDGERQYVWQMIESARERNKDVPDEVLQAEVDEAVRWVRAHPESPIQP